MAAKISNKQMIRKTALRFFVYNKNKYIALFISVMLTSVLFTSVFTIGKSVYDTYMRTMMRAMGSKMMVTVYSEDPDIAEKLINDPSVKNVAPMYNVGIVVHGEDDKNLVPAAYIPEASADEFYIEVKYGKYPVKKNEIAMDMSSLKELGIRPEAGMPLHIRYMVFDGEYIEDDFILSGWWDTNLSVNYGFALVSEEYYRTFSQDHSDYITVGVDFGSSIFINQKTSSMMSEHPECLNSVVNSSFMFFEPDPTAVLILSGLVLLVIFTGYLIINNIFNISISYDIRQYGLLKTMGATKKQISRIVMIQAQLIGLISSVPGVLAGVFVSEKAFYLITESFNVEKDDVYITRSFIIYVFTVLFTLLTIKLGCSKPAKTAGKVSPAESVNYQRAIPKMNKRKKAVHRRLSLASLAFSNIMTEKKKTVFVVLSVAVPVFIANSIYVYAKGVYDVSDLKAEYGNSIHVCHKAWREYDLDLNSNSVVSSEQSEYLRSVPGVKDSMEIYFDPDAWFIPDSTQKNSISDILASIDISSEEIMYQDKVLCNIYGTDEKTARSSLYENELFDQKKWDSGEYAIVNAYSYHLDENDLAQYFCSKDAEITVSFGNGNTRKLKIMAFGEMPEKYQSGRYFEMGFNVIVPSSSFDEDLRSDSLAHLVLYTDDDLEKTEKNIKEYIESQDDLLYLSDKTAVDDMIKEKRNFETVSAVLMTIIFAVSFLNFINTFSSSVFRRTGEFGIMQALGLTEKQLCSVIAAEGSMYSVFIFSTSLIMYCLFGKPVFRAFTAFMIPVKYRFSLYPVLISFPIVLVLALITSAAVLKILKRKTITEQMKY